MINLKINFFKCYFDFKDLFLSNSCDSFLIYITFLIYIHISILFKIWILALPNGKTLKFKLVKILGCSIKNVAQIFFRNLSLNFNDIYER